MDGIYIAGRRPRSKREVREAIVSDASRVRIESTSFPTLGYDGPVSDAPAGTYYIVGPDPYTSRKFYGTITIGVKGIKVS